MSTERNSGPGNEDLASAITKATGLVLAKKYLGRPPLGQSWMDLHQDIILRAWPRVKRFKPGGKKTLQEFCYMAAYYAMIDMLRMEQSRQAHVKGIRNPFRRNLNNSHKS